MRKHQSTAEASASPNEIHSQKPLSKRTRFEIFKRDGFTCQYCGRRPPEVVLEVDHIHPRSKGGADNDINLISSCADCNRGKAAKMLTDVSPRPDADLRYLEVQQEVAEAERYLKSREVRDRYEAQLIAVLQSTWDTKLPYWTAPSDAQVRGWLDDYGAEPTDNAIRTLANRALRGRVQFKTSAVDYVSGILYNRSREQVE